MTQHLTDVDADLAMLRERHPSWFFTTFWAHDRRRLAAQGHGLILSDFTADALSAKIEREDQALARSQPAGG